MKFQYRVHPIDCRPGSWYEQEGDTVRHALMEVARNGVTTDGDPVRVEVRGGGFWWLECYTEIRVSVTSVAGMLHRDQSFSNVGDFMNNERSSVFFETDVSKTVDEVMYSCIHYGYVRKESFLREVARRLMCLADEYEAE